MATEETQETTRLERVLATMVITTIGLSLLCFFAVILAGPLNYSLDNPLGMFVLALPAVGLPIGFLLMLALIITNLVRRRRSASADVR